MNISFNVLGGVFRIQNRIPFVHVFCARRGAIFLPLLQSAEVYGPVALEQARRRIGAKLLLHVPLEAFPGVYALVGFAVFRQQPLPALHPDCPPDRFHGLGKRNVSSGDLRVQPLVPVDFPEACGRVVRLDDQPVSDLRTPGVQRPARDLKLQAPADEVYPEAPLPRVLPDAAHPVRQLRVPEDPGRLPVRAVCDS